MKLTVLFLVTLPLVGCASYRWIKAGSTESEFNSDRYGCQKDSMQAYSPNVQNKVFYDAYANVRGKSKCTTTAQYGGNALDTECDNGNYPAPATQQVDVNEEGRNNFFKSCMVSKGWNLRKVD